MYQILNKITGVKSIVDYSSVMVIYQTSEGSWRGFVVPFDITYEAETKSEVKKVLHDMIFSYVQALKEYDNPSHLADVPLSDNEDEKKWSRISWDVFSQLKNNISRIERNDYYAEAQLPA